MARLPTPGSDSGSWGNILNDFLSVELESDGTLKRGATIDSMQTTIATLADDSTVVHIAGDEAIAGTKTFASSPVVPTPTTTTQVSNKSYVDSAIASNDVATRSFIANSYVNNRKAIANRLLSSVRTRAEAFVVSSTTPTITGVAASFGAANATPAAPFTGALLRTFMRVGSTTTVDVDNDPHFELTGHPVAKFGGGYPDYFTFRPDLLTGGAPQAARWRPTLKFCYSGSKFVIATKQFSTSFIYRLKVDGQYITSATAMQTITGLTTGGLANITIDFGSAAQREIELAIVDPALVGIWIEPTATIARPRADSLRIAALGDSITGGANGVGSFETWGHYVANMYGADWNNLAIGGSGFIAPSTFRSRIPDAQQAKPDVLVVFGGYNDAAISNYTAIKAEATYVLGQLNDLLPRTLIIAAGPWVSSGSYSSTLSATNDAIRDSATLFSMPFIDLTTPLGVPTNYPAWSAINYEVGQVVSYNNQIWMCIARGTVGSFDTTRWQPIGWVWGTGKQSVPTGTGNADVIISSDGVHPTAMGHQILGERFAAEISRIARTMLE